MRATDRIFGEIGNSMEKASHSFSRLASSRIEDTYIRISEQAIGVYTTVESTVQQVRYILLLYFLYGIV
jgi:hypothetical protein